MKGSYLLSLVTWASTTVLIWLIVLDYVPADSLRWWALAFFFVVAIVSSMMTRGDEVRQKRQQEFYKHQQEVRDSLDRVRKSVVK